MSEIIDQINREFRQIFNELDASGISAEQLVEEVNQRFMEQGCYLLGRRSFPVFVKPVFITETRIKYVSHVTEVLMDVWEKVTDLYYSTPEVRNLFELKPEETELAAIDPGFRKRIKITRNDAFMTDDYFKIIEFNTDSPGGPMYSDMQNRIIASTPVMQKLKEKYTFRSDYFVPQVEQTLLSTYREFGGKKEKPFIAIVAGNDSLTLPEFLLIAEWFREKGYGSEYADPRQLEYDGEYLRTPKGDIIDVIYRRGWLPHWTDHMTGIQHLIKAYKERKVCVVNPPNSILGNNKSLMEVVQKPELQNLFTDQEKKCIAENLPWTRLVRETKTDFKGKEIDLYDFIRNNRELLILKPMDQFGGKDVCIGLDSDNAKWDEWIQKTTKNRYVVQEYVPIPIDEFPVVTDELIWLQKKINVNFFAYNGKYAGGMVRTSDAFVISVSAGGGLTPILVVEGH